MPDRIKLEIVCHYTVEDIEFSSDIEETNIYMNGCHVQVYHGYGCWASAKAFADGAGAVALLRKFPFEVEYKQLANIIV